MVPRLLVVVLVVALCCAPLAAQEGQHGKTASGQLTAEERAKVVKLLIDSNKQAIEMLESVSDAQARFKAAPEKWSMAEVGEHIAMAEGLLFSQVEKALAAPENPDWEQKTKGKTAFLEKALINRTTKASAPETIVPTGKLSRTEVIAQLKESRAKTLKFAESTQQPLKSHTAEHPFPVFNTLNAYQWLIYIPLHNLRHNQQMAEVKAAPLFPNK